MNNKTTKIFAIVLLATLIMPLIYSFTNISYAAELAEVELTWDSALAPVVTSLTHEEWHQKQALGGPKSTDDEGYYLKDGDGNNTLVFKNGSSFINIISTENYKKQNIDSNKTYYLSYNIYVKPTYTVNVRNVKVKLNGVERADAIIGNFVTTARFFPVRIPVEVGAKANEKIESVNVTLAEPTVSSNPANVAVDKTDSITASVEWQEWNAATSSVVNTLTSSNEFEAGKEYRAQITLDAKSGYEFSSSASVQLNNENITLDSVNASKIVISKTWKLSMKDVTEIDIQIEQPKVGQKPAATAKVVSAPADSVSSNSFAITWLEWNETTNQPVGTTNLAENKQFVFEAGKSYIAKIKIMSKAGYKFDNLNTSVNVNKVAASKKVVAADAKSIDVENVWKLETEQPVVYTVQEGNNQTYTINKSTELKFKIDADYNTFTKVGKVYVDNKLVENTNYTSKSGSTVITLKKEFVDKLSKGEHELKVEYGNSGIANAKFTVVDESAKSDNTTNTSNKTNTSNTTNTTNTSNTSNTTTNTSRNTTNSTNTTKSTTSNPKTSDNIMIYVATLVISILGIGYTYTKMKFINENYNNK